MDDEQKYAELLAAGKLFPSPEPDGETVVSESPAFVDACTSRICEFATELGWTLEKSVLTRSDMWGLVWRIDFKAEGHPEHSDTVNRHICWGSADGTILGSATVTGQKPL